MHGGSFSTESTLLVVYDNLIITIGQQKVTAVIFLISAAFDTIDQGNYMFWALAGELNPGPTLRSPDPDLQLGVLTTGLTHFTEPNHGQS